MRNRPILEDGILRVRGRIGAIRAPAETEQPIILDGKHRTTKLIVLREHCAATRKPRTRNERPETAVLDHSSATYSTNSGEKLRAMSSEKSEAAATSHRSVPLVRVPFSRASLHVPYI